MARTFVTPILPAEWENSPMDIHDTEILVVDDDQTFDTEQRPTAFC